MTLTSLAFDTSNYTTSVAVCSHGEIVENRKLPVEVKAGERGVRQSDAVFAHTRNLAEITDQLSSYTFDCIGVSTKPRDVAGSYMPCFLSGLACAKALSGVLGIPVYEYSHQRGHIAAALYSTGRLALLNQRFYSFHLSGGTTELLLYQEGDITKIGGTKDISAGQLIDRTGVKLGYSFPCGGALDRVAAEAENTPNVLLKDGGLYCNLSGIENQVDRLMTDGAGQSEISRFVLLNICTAVENMLRAAFLQYGKYPVLFAGGVSASHVLRQYFSDRYDALFPAAEFSLDNAAGVAILAIKEHDGTNQS